MRTNRRQAIAIAASVLAAPATVRAKVAPMAKIFCPFAAGATVDMVCRQLAEQLRGKLADTVIVENRTGAAGLLAIDALVRAPADGLTLMVHGGAIQSVFPHTMRKLPYDPFEDVAPVSTTHQLEYAFAVGPGVPVSVKTLNDFLSWVRLNPKGGAFATPGSGTPLHFVPMLVSQASKVELVPVHYRGSAAAMPDLLGGQVSAISTALSDLVPFLGEGKLRMLATSGPRRNPLTPGAATYAEQGFPDATAVAYNAVFVHGQTAPAVQEQISAMVREALATEAVRTAFSKAYIVPSGSTPAETLKAGREGYTRWGGIVKAVGYVPEN
ncbi:tripartite tricarboxylate transporter substrate-binding protein [Hydrogenophaga sp.]|uniref:tripartite tricarboxylate transporter substrate-binding protein n=1 Tax=Hydrogenophaga sp. TaxID=1904254 RepID=UPI002722B1C8|nr:tripartite tricarboxylate transporter substrate-binding protein [Hydrogenophaga sp.]MDO9433827.1 tripartite tricarboxylate transporter substrate-binding protein [Hydrogenophaga sp.]